MPLPKRIIHIRRDGYDTHRGSYNITEFESGRDFARFLYGGDEDTGRTSIRDREYSLYALYFG